MRNILSASLLTMAGAMLALPAARAATPTNADGDLYLAFRLDGGTSDYLVDIGQANLYSTGTGASFTVTNLTVNGIHLQALGTDLTNLFGTWQGSAGATSFVHWSVAGTDLAGDPANTTYISQQEAIVGTLSGAILRPNGSVQSQANSNLEGLAYAYTGGYRPSYALTASGGEVQGSSDPSSYASYQPPSLSTNYGVYTNAEGSFKNGAGTSVLDLYRVVPNNTAGTPAAYEGSFSISSTGVVTFQSVPEPATGGLLLGGAVLGGFLRRRRTLV